MVYRLKNKKYHMDLFQDRIVAKILIVGWISWKIEVWSNSFNSIYKFREVVENILNLRFPRIIKVFLKEGNRMWKNWGKVK